MFVFRQFFVGFLALFVCISGQVLREGGCPNVNFIHYEWQKMHGRWYRVEKYPEYHPVQYCSRCTSEIEIRNPNGTFTVLVSYENTKTCEYIQDLPVALIIRDKDKPDITTVAADKLPLPAYTYKILDIDYGSHFILYGCAEAGPDKNWSLDNVVIFSHSPTPLTKCLKERLHEILRKNDINPDFLQPVDQKNCPKR